MNFEITSTLQSRQLYNHFQLELELVEDGGLLLAKASGASD
jgi:hypothetical protein